MFQTRIKLLNADSQSPGFVSAGSAYGDVYDICVNAISGVFVA
jgi:hypothetical protein